MTKHPSRNVMNFRQLLGCDTIACGLQKMCFRIGFVRMWLINIAQHFMFLENKLREAYSSSSKRHFVYCTCITSFSFNFDWLYPMTHVSSGDKKGVVFFLTFASSFMWCGQFF